MHLNFGRVTKITSGAAVVLAALLAATDARTDCEAARTSPSCATHGLSGSASVGLARLARSLAAPSARVGPGDTPASVVARQRVVRVLAALSAAAPDDSGGGSRPGGAPSRDVGPSDAERAPAKLALLPPPPPPPPPPALPRDKAEAGVPQAHVFARARPVDGRVVSRFGASGPAGDMRRGITFEAPHGATVRAPAAGRVAFAGRFRGYGLLLIVEHTDGYHSLLTGFEQIDTHIGSRVDAGDPVGIVARRDGRVPQVYLELRRDGRPVDPLPWLAPRKRKVGG